MIMVHHYAVIDGVDVCKHCGMVRNKDRVGPQYCTGKLPPIEARAKIIDEWKSANGYNDLLKAYSDAVQARNDALSNEHATAKENEAMLLTIEKLTAELAKPEDVRLREAVDAMGDRCPQFFSLAGRIDRLLDDVDEWIGRAGSAERTVEEQGRLLASTQNIVRELQSAPKGGAHVDVLHRRIDALVAIAEAAEELCGVVGERAADGDFNPLPQASLTGAVREEIAPHVFRQWAAAKAALHRADVPPEVHESGWQWRPTDPDTAFAPPFGTIRVCRACGCLVAGGPTACSRCVAVEGAKR